MLPRTYSKRLGEKYRAYFSNPILEDSRSSPTTLQLIRDWCLSCRANHETCNRFVQQDGWCPTRLIDIGNHDEEEWQLYIPPKSGCTRPVYITLSYRWGSDDAFKLTEEKLRSGFHGRIEDLAQTFKDAVMVARLLSVRYLWVDRLCIVQDSRLDWETESVEMRRVYANSFCNIAASASTSPKGGLFRSRNLENIQPGWVVKESETSEENRYHVVDMDYLNRQVYAGPLHRRGWVFQERMLAPRTIHFAEDQVVWECFEELKCEQFPKRIPMIFPIKSDFDILASAPGISTVEKTLHESNIARLWDSLLRSYTHCSFTKESDRLVAFSGIAHLFQETTGDEYVAGLWRSCLVESLAWRTESPAMRPSNSYCAPSWSWASISGPVTMLACDESQAHVTISDVQVQ